MTIIMEDKCFEATVFHKKSIYEGCSLVAHAIEFFTPNGNMEIYAPYPTEEERDKVYESLCGELRRGKTILDIPKSKDEEFNALMKGKGLL